MNRLKCEKARKGVGGTSPTPFFLWCPAWTAERNYPDNSSLDYWEDNLVFPNSKSSAVHSAQPTPHKLFSIAPVQAQGESLGKRWNYLICIHPELSNTGTMQALSPAFYIESLQPASGNLRAPCTWLNALPVSL